MNTKSATFTFDAVAWLSKIINGTFFLAANCLTKIDAFLRLDTSRVHWFLHLTLKKHQSYFAPSLLTIGYLIGGLF